MSRGRTDGAYAGCVILWVFLALVAVFIILPLVLHVFWFFFWTAVVGLIMGGLGRLIVPGHNPIGVLPTIVCGLIGSLVGGAIGHALGGWFVTILVEMGVAAASVAIWSATHRTSIGRSRPAIGR